MCSFSTGALFMGLHDLGCDCVSFFFFLKKKKKNLFVFFLFFYFLFFFALRLDGLIILELNPTVTPRCLIPVSALQAVRFDCVCRLSVFFLLVECVFLFYWRSFCGSGL